MIRKTINLIIFILALFVPSAIFMIVFSVLEFEIRPFIPMIAVTSVFFAAEVIAAQRGDSFIWAAVSTTMKDKMVFAACLISFWSIVLLPIFLKIEILYVNLMFIAIAFLVVAIIVTFFASKTMKDDLLRKRNVLK